MQVDMWRERSTKISWTYATESKSAKEMTYPARTQLSPPTAQLNGAPTVVDQHAATLKGIYDSSLTFGDLSKARWRRRFDTGDGSGCIVIWQYVV